MQSAKNNSASSDSYFARVFLLRFGELNTKDFSLEELLNLDDTTLSGLTKRQVSGIWTRLLNKPPSFPKLLDFFARTRHFKPPARAWKTIINHKRFTLPGLCRILDSAFFLQPVYWEVMEILSTTTRWTADDLWKYAQKIRDDRGLMQKTRDIVIEAIIQRDDCSTDLLLEVANGPYGKSSGMAIWIMAQRKDCPLGFVLQRIVTHSFGEKNDKKLLAAVKKRLPEVRQMARTKKTSRKKK